MFATAGRSRSCGTRMRCLWIRPVPIEHILALRLRIAVSFAAIESLVGFRRRSTQRDRALLLSHFHFVSEIWHEVVPHANATSPVWRLRSGVPGRRTSILLRPSAGFKSSRNRRHRLPARISVVSILSKALVANMAKALTPAGASDSSYFEWKPWLKPVHAVALRLPGFIAIPSTA